MAIFKERIKSSNSVSLGICSYKEVRMANNSPAAPTAEWSCESNFFRKDSYFQYIPSPPTAASSLVCILMRFSPATHPTFGLLK